MEYNKNDDSYVTFDSKGKKVDKPKDIEIGFVNETTLLHPDEDIFLLEKSKKSEFISTKKE